MCPGLRVSCSGKTLNCQSQGSLRHSRELLSGARVSVEGVERFSRAGERRKEGTQSPSWGQEFREAMDSWRGPARVSAKMPMPELVTGPAGPAVLIRCQQRDP